ncbi:ribokinase [Rhodococcus sp. BP-349]|uniref:ribokinase n=1 Tax=unclassified Rhodococcus (in: high G+C Gram-positive bacteria) TaxID=192944 RepID=UPI001C9A3985|nr:MULTISPECIES: ribokinase [unclassified Rhodococcus (in: high G+C Gram-positive bacteria)]MBY6540542.1 ribokinase [Rhodococcus sp. BP-363]MBY6545433.1 ribokinase [Rhodococcus sp. BP-369]MBY6564663.1 ribokinase [Rhodococcus sp. BP-370]MBY6578401.1 ribokinase [Rhodococcus sp. BP-364]MBY6587702.1 ribokinase [Rhodococcus sp. BP-358]
MAAPDTARPRITIVGSINMDLVARTPALPVPGETVLGSAFRTTPGGKGANQAVAAARAGAEVVFVGAVGSDTFALDLRETLVGAEVDASLLREVEGASGVAVITVDDAAENSIVVVGGANETLTELTAEELAAVAEADVLLCQLEIPVATVVAAARHARAHDTLVFLNPSPVQPLSDDLVGLVDVAIVNRDEESALGDALGRIPHVVTTLGADGARHRGVDGVVTTHTSPVVDAVDTTGAGDVFAGTLAAAWRDGPAASVRRACAAGAVATTRDGAGSSAPTAAEVDRALAGTQDA